MLLKKINILLTILVIIVSSNKIVNNDELQQVGILIVGGAQCDPKSYEKLQAELIDYMSKKQVKVFSKILEFSLNTPNPLEISQKVFEGIDNLKNQGMEQDNVFIVAHSLGGVMSQDYLQDYEDKIKGLILMGSVILRNFREVDDEGESKININFKTLTLLGTKDGLMRISRGAEQFYHQVYNIKKSENIHDMIIFEGLSHSNFMDNQLIPSFVKINDLKSQLDQQTGYTQIAQAIEGFMQKVLKKNEKEEYLKLQAESSRIILPLMQSMILEGNYQLKKPCYDNKLINPLEKNCLKGSPWVQNIAQNSMSGQIQSNIIIENDDNFHRVYTITPVHLPEIENTCDQNSTCTLKTVTVSENVYDILNEQLDTGLIAIAASEIRVKMSSRQNVQKHLNNPDDDFHKLDEEGDRCAEINQKAIDYALQYSSQQALDNYNNYGLKLKVGSDLGPFNAGPLWIWKYMQYSQQDDKTILVQSPMMRTPINYWISSAAGFHYCKVLSPFKVMEFIYIDSIKGREPK